MIEEGPVTAPEQELMLTWGDVEKSFNTKEDGFFRVQLFRGAGEAGDWLEENT